MLGVDNVWKGDIGRGIFRIFVYGKGNLQRFRDKIGFLHPLKKKKLDRVLEDYVDYLWKFPSKEHECFDFVRGVLVDKLKIRSGKYLRIFSREKVNLERLNRFLKKFYGVEGILYERVNGLGARYFEMNINKRVYVERLIEEGVVPNIFKE